MLYENKTWYLSEDKVEILKIVPCGVKLTEKRSSSGLKDFLDLEETLNKIAKANGVR